MSLRLGLLPSKQPKTLDFFRNEALHIFKKLPLPNLAAAAGFISYYMTSCHMRSYDTIPHHTSYHMTSYIKPYDNIDYDITPDHTT